MSHLLTYSPLATGLNAAILIGTLLAIFALIGLGYRHPRFYRKLKYLVLIWLLHFPWGTAAAILAGLLLYTIRLEFFPDEENVADSDQSEEYVFGRNPDE